MEDKKHPFATIASAIAADRLNAAQLDILEGELKRFGGFINPQREPPGRAALRKQLERVQDASKQFGLALRAFPAQLLSVDDWANHLEDRALVEALMRNIASRVSLADEKIRKGPGPTVKTRMIDCARIIILCWKQVHGSLPGSTNFKAQQIIDDYWVACGGSRGRKYENGAVVRWQRHMGPALKQVAQPRERSRVEVSDDQTLTIHPNVIDPK
jgi:hypothetical protein